VSQNDLDGVKATLNTQLQQQALRQLQDQMAAGEQIAGQTVFTTKVSSDNPVGAQVNQVRVQVSVLASALVYNIETAHQVAEQLLSKQASQTLKGNYRLKGSPSFTNTAGVQLAQNDVVYLSVAVRGVWVYNFSDQQINTWLQSIKGATPTLASTYLTSQRGVSSVQVQLPFGTDHLPMSIDQINVVFVNK
jgi:hypothetical protein